MNKHRMKRSSAPIFVLGKTCVLQKQCCYYYNITIISVLFLPWVSIPCVPLLRQHWRTENLNSFNPTQFCISKKNRFAVLLQSSCYAFICYCFHDVFAMLTLTCLIYILYSSASIALTTKCYRCVSRLLINFLFSQRRGLKRKVSEWERGGEASAGQLSNLITLVTEHSCSCFRPNCFSHTNQPGHPSCSRSL